jgi:hypothetical protein
MPLVLKMASPQQRSWCVLQLAKKESVTAVQRAFRTQLYMEPPSRESICAWHKKFEHKGCIYKNKSPGRSSVSDATVDRVRASFQRSPGLTPCDFFLWGYTKGKVFVLPLPRSLPDSRQRITTAISSITRDTAQSLGRVGLSSRHLPCDSRSTYRISVRCIQNFVSFSIEWYRYEVLSTPHLFSVSF